MTKFCKDSGHREPDDWYFANTQRYSQVSTDCGIDGKYWEPK